MKTKMVGGLALFVGFGALAVAATQVTIVPSNDSFHVGDTITFVVSAASDVALNEIGLELCDGGGTPVENLGNGSGEGEGGSVSMVFSLTASAPGTYFFDGYAWNDDRSQLSRTGVIVVTVVANNFPPQVNGISSSTSVQAGDTVTFDISADCENGLNEIGLESCEADGTAVGNLGIVGVSGSSASSTIAWVAPAPGTYYFDVYAWNADRSLLTRSGVITVIVN